MDIQKVKMLFDYQHIFSNEKLSGIIAETGARYNLDVPGIELSDSELNLNAAGEATMSKPNEIPNDDTHA